MLLGIALPQDPGAVSVLICESPLQDRLLPTSTDTCKALAQGRDSREGRSRSTGFQASGSRVQTSDFKVQGSGVRVQGSGSRIQGAGFRGRGAGVRVQGAGFRFQVSGFRVHGAGFKV